MHRHSHMRPDGAEAAARAMRSPSISSDVVSTSTRSITSSVPIANPQPAYIAQAEASKLISTELDRDVTLMPSALALVNDFLDHVLYTILSTSRSLSLGALRTAVPIVLKPRLGKAAIRVAEEELKEYLDDEDDVDVSANSGPISPRYGFDLELAWKLARLRCMVYTRLGDLEEEDEEEWLEREQLELASSPDGLKQGDIVVGPPSAIFLTSVIEYLGEQALYYAAQHAQKRHNLNQHREIDGIGQTSTLSTMSDEIVLDGKDMNHVGRDSALSRLWRSWRRNTRETGSRAMSPSDDVRSPMSDSSTHSRTGSYGRSSQPLAYRDMASVAEAHSPSQIPLPITDRDIDEIEIPGLASAHSDSESDTPDIPDRSHKRPVSMSIMPGAFPGSLSLPTQQQEQEPDPHAQTRPAYFRKRSMSTPMPSRVSFSSFRPADSTINGQIAEAEVEHESIEPRVDPSANEKVIVEDESPTTQTDHQTSPAQSDSVVNRRERVPSQDQDTLSKRVGMIGGAMAAAVGALGAGAAVATATAPKERNIVSIVRDDEEKIYEPSPSPVVPKRTVAEEMLGTGSAVAPPKDATTGASITNVSDFDCMYVPVQMPLEASPIAELDADPMSMGGMIPSRNTASRSSAYDDHRASRSVPQLLQHEVEGNHRPKRSIDGKRVPGDVLPPIVTAKRSDVVNSNPSIYQPPSDEHATTGLRPGSVSPLKDSPVSPLPSAVFRRETPDPAISSTSEDTIVPRPAPLASSPVKHAHSESKTSIYSQHSKSSSSSSRLLGFTRDAQGRPQTISQQRASGAMSEDARAAHSSTPTSGNRDGRPETANSSNSKMFGRNHKASDSGDDFKKKSLEILIQSNETLHYTLTPTTVMKQDESFNTAKKRSETQDMADFIRNTGPPETLPVRPQEPQSISSPTTHDIVTTADETEPQTPARRSVIPSSQGVPQPLSSPDRPRNPLGQPRGARTEHSTAIRDLADYARSTGPVDDTQLSRALSPRPTTPGKLQPSPNLVKTASSAGKPTNRLKLQARDPRPSRRAETSDLIDFIREGPPREPGDHRIDRKVAPFRTTMDSEDFNNLNQPVERENAMRQLEGISQERGPGGPSVVSRNVSLSNNKHSNGVVNGGRAAAPKQRISEDDGRPPRTRVRNKDPYAIDYSDGEEDDYDHQGSPKMQRNEESLIDFLRNTAPPPGMETQPILAVRPSNLPPPGVKNRGASEGSPHLTQTGSKADKYRPTQPTHAAHVDRNRSKPKFEAREPTAPRTGTSDLADYLRDSEPPPSANNGQPQPFILSNSNQTTSENDGGLFKMFSKRKR